MGKGRIIAAHGEGRYTIEIVEDRARAQAARALAVQHVADLEKRISAIEADLAEAVQAMVNASLEQDAAIAQYQQDMLEHGLSSVDVSAWASTVQEAAEKRNSLHREIQLLKAERMSRQSLIKRTDALPSLRQVDAWCADYTENLAGEVATAEVPGEVGQVLIKPGFHDGAAWSPAADGAIQPALSGTPSSVFYNLAMMPGWQKWRPTFRIATISNIDNDLCDITIVPASSSLQGHNVNAQSHYAGVPIFYMDCNGDAFKNGDRVLVAFSGNTDQPMVVGFEREPQECGFPEVVHEVIVYKLTNEHVSWVWGYSTFYDPDTAYYPNQDFARTDPGLLGVADRRLSIPEPNPSITEKNILIAEGVTLNIKCSVEMPTYTVENAATSSTEVKSIEIEISNRGKVRTLIVEIVSSASLAFSWVSHEFGGGYPVSTITAQTCSISIREGGASLASINLPLDVLPTRMKFWHITDEGASIDGHHSFGYCMLGSMPALVGVAKEAGDFIVSIGLKFLVIGDVVGESRWALGSESFSNSVSGIEESFNRAYKTIRIYEEGGASIVPNQEDRPELF